MTVISGSPGRGSPKRTRTRIPLRPAIGAPARMPILRATLACLLGLAAALLVSCGSSTNGLIPAADAGPLKSDFETVAQAARSGDGSCAATEAAILKTEQDFSALPSTIDSGLHSTLLKGIENLRARALVLCAQPLPQATATSTSPKTATGTQTSSTTPAVTQTTGTQTTPTTTATTPATPGAGGGTPAPGEPQGPSGNRSGSGNERGNSGGIEQGGKEGGAGSGGRGSGGAGGVGQEGGK